MIEFGTNGFSVSRIGLGLAALGRPGYINLNHNEDIGENKSVKKMEAHIHRMLDKAFQSGINYFDAAQSYGKAETFLGNWLKMRSSGHIIVGSKWGYYYTADWQVDAEKHEIKDHGVKRLRLQWRESKERLDPYLKVYQIHSATFESGVLENMEVMEELDRIKSEGYTIGITVSGEYQAEVLNAALNIKISGKPLFGSVQVTYNLLEQSAENSIKKAYDQGTGVIIKEALANGRLTGRNKSAPYYKLLHALARDYGLNEDAVAMAYVLKKSYVHLVLSGAVREEHLDSNLDALKVDLSDSDIRKLDACKMDVKAYWGERSKLKWN